MPIPVVCPGCKVRFNVSDKFAGKKGPCPKCKAVITIPEPVKDEVKIHVPEQFASAGKDSKGRAVSKPIPRRDTKFKPAMAGAVAAGAVAVLGVCFVARGLPNKIPVIIVGLAAISAPLAAAGYTFLREQELEPYRGRELWIRAAICGAVYALLWALFIPVSNVMTGDPWQWLIVAPLFICMGGATALGALDLDFGSGALHYSFYLLVTLLLRWAIALPFVWQLQPA